MHVRSGCLFHFTDSLAKLTSILKNGFWPSYVVEDIAWQGEESNQRLAFPMVCFCDIPLQRTTAHRKAYGQYAIGVSRQWAASKGASPVLYLGAGSLTADTLVKIRQAAISSERERLRDLRDQTQQAHAPMPAEAFGPGVDLTATRRLHMFCKPVEGDDPGSGEPRQFIRESEWRYVPPAVWDPLSDLVPYLTPEFHEHTGQMNMRLSERAALKVPPEELRYVLVKGRSETAELAELCTAQCPVLSFEQIEDDF